MELIGAIVCWKSCDVWWFLNKLHNGCTDIFSFSFHSAPIPFYAIRFCVSNAIKPFTTLKTSIIAWQKYILFAIIFH